MVKLYFYFVKFFYIKFKFGTIRIYSMYTFITHISVLLLPSLEHGRARNQILDYPKMSPIEFITHMYNRSATIKAFKEKEKKNILAPGTELNIHNN